MSLVCSSPKFEVSNDQTSYFNMMPGSYMATPASDKPHSPGYFDIKSKPSPSQTPYYDVTKPASPAQTPFFDCESMQTPFFEQLQQMHGIRHTNTNNENSNNNQQQFQQFQFNLNIKNGINGNPGITISQLPFTPKIPSIQRRSSTKPSSLPSTNKGKPYSMPGLSPYNSATTTFEEYSLDNVANLINQKLSNSSTPNLVLLLDLRSFSMYTANHIKTSLNICVPSTLLKRCSFSADKITDTLVSDGDKDVFKDWPKYENIILYDSETDTLSETCPLFHLCKKFRSPVCKAKIGYLKGGFTAFHKKYEGLCEKTLNDTPSSSGTFPRRRSLMNRKPGPFTCPTPIIEISGVNPFFTNIRQNIELSSGITETIPIRLPEGAVFDNSQIPAFMRDIIGDNGKMKLAESFHEIERIEQRRLQSLMLHNSNQVTPDCPFSISAGMEKGTKNRYNNIWPYDHARVKIGECKEGDCDYVNASFVQAEKCNKRYIATQGPLPATYEDFWKVIWEQNSRVIVMLTKEEEAGRIQCHRYWSECTINPCRFGPIVLQFISESSNGSMNKNNTIVTRKFRLSHTNHPEIPAREITQLHFLGWPDFGIPDSPNHILNLIDIANFTQSQAVQSSSHTVGPMVVHCSAGCGRTGAFCTIDSTLSLLNEIREQGLDVSQDLVQKVVLKFREQRLSMVQTLRQYVFCYEAVLWKLIGAA
ncbi:protein-tyrosine phosphatase-like protein [Glomus cerebriforme]|uniref:protein-tyrosine-phosphatase n=1 Tax=Glomus cerebriforme TaxID=658196 RepID=A0A397SZ60_9GLOM|nr:protein-tyrosine phosphatase-like protein [Glomus cerebriforme]